MFRERLKFTLKTMGVSTLTFIGIAALLIAVVYLTSLIPPGFGESALNLFPYLLGGVVAIAILIQLGIYINWQFIEPIRHDRKRKKDEEV